MNTELTEQDKEILEFLKQKQERESLKYIRKFKK